MTTLPRQRTATAPAEPELDRAELAGRTWSRLRTLVLDLHDRRKEVSVALEMGYIRAKALMKVSASPCKLRELATRLGTDAPYTTLIVDDLEKRGLVVRTPHPDDRRSKLVSVTEAGRVAARVAQDILDEPPATVLDLDTEDLIAFDRIVGALADES